MKNLVAITSRGRSETLKMTLERYPYLKDCGVLFLTFFDPTKEQYKKIGMPFEEIEASNLSTKRAKIVTKAIKEGYETITFVDDDILLGVASMRGLCIKTATNDEFKDCLVELAEICSSSFPLVSPISRGFSSKIDYKYNVNKLAIRIVTVHLPTLDRRQLNYDDLALRRDKRIVSMSDKYIQLALINAGHETIGLGKYRIDDRGTGMAGGCQLYRTAKLQSLAAVHLNREFPYITKLRIKKNEGNWTEKRLEITYDFRDTPGRSFVPNNEMEIHKITLQIKEGLNEI